MDTSFLEECFVDNGDLDILRDCNDQRCLIAGRTGAGKSALLSQLQRVEDNVLTISPESLAITYIANSNVINFFLEAGVKMDIFYRLLWRHIFVVEILKTHYKIENEESKQNFLRQLWTYLPKNNKHQLALDYLKSWGGSFWEETEYRIKEVTKTFEKDLQGTVDGKMPSIGGLSIHAAQKLTEEEKAEVVSRAQEVVNKVQIRELSTVIELLSELIPDPQKKYFIVIDKLDEDWVPSPIKYKLIRALIETTADFARVPSVKIAVALRYDLIDSVFRSTRRSGFQEEKIRSNMLHLSWAKADLTELLDRRIDLLVREQYTSKDVTHKDFLPPKIGKQSTIDYLLRRTHYRPRDIIQFFNTCIVYADGKPKINTKIIREAEGAYSRERLGALVDEWYSLYPNLRHLTKLLRSRQESFLVLDIPLNVFDENCLELLISGQAEDGLDKNYMDSYSEERLSIDNYRINIIHILYKVGVIGLKLDSTSRTEWAGNTFSSVSKAEIGENTRISIHPTYWRTLGVEGHKQ